MALDGKLRHPKRLITTHNSDGLAIFETALAEDAPFYKLPRNNDQNKGDVEFATMYTTEGFPTKLYDGKSTVGSAKDPDLQVYTKYLENRPGIVINNGTVIRYVDMPPGHTSPMHRTVSLDYGVVVEGEVALVLDSGEERVMKRGDVSVQRATNHAWRNQSETEWARMLYILQPCQPVEIGGKKLGEDIGDMAGVRPSS
jgi:quercetin dioxygenase-like cupin family protein